MSDSAVRRQAPHPVLASVAALVVLIALLAVGVRQIPADGLRPRLEAAFTRNTGRALRIDGPLRFTLLPSPGLLADDVSVANGPGGSRPVMAQARRVAVAVSLTPLLRGELRVTAVGLTDPVVLLERLPDGTPNWRFVRPARATAAPDVASGSSAQTRRRLDLTVDTITSTGGRLTWNDPRTVGAGQVDLVSLHGHLARDGAPATLWATGMRGTTPFRVSLEAGQPASGTSSSPPGTPGSGSFRSGSSQAGSSRSGSLWPIRAVFTAGLDPRALRLSADGLLDDEAGRLLFSGKVAAQVLDSAVLDDLFPHAAIPHAADVDLHAVLGVGPDGRETVRALSLAGRDLALERAGRSLTLARFAIGADTPDAPVRADLVGTLDATPVRVVGPAIGSLALWSPGNRSGGTSAPLDATVSVGPDALQLRGTVTRTGALSGQLAATTAALNLPDPGVIASLFGRASPFHRALTVSGPATMAFDGTARRGTLDIDARTWALDGRSMPPLAVDASVDPASVDARLAVTPRTPPFLVWHVVRSVSDGAPAPATLALNGKDLPAGPILWALEHQDGLDGRLDLTGSLAGTARGTTTMVGATITGPLDATLRDARLDRALARRLLGSVLATTKLPLPALGALPVRCAAVTGRFENGLYTASALSLDTPVLVLDGNGTADLGRELFALRLHPTVRVGGVGASTDLALDGPFDQPSVHLAAGAGGRFALAVGSSAASAGCDTLPGVGPAPKPKAPRAVDILRGLGLIR